MFGAKKLDLDYVKEHADLLTLASHDTVLRKFGSEYKGACPMPGCPSDNDGFSVQPDQNTWVCRHCSGGYRSVIDYIALRDNLDPHNQEQLIEICRRALAGELPTSTIEQAKPKERPVKPQAAAPKGEWQTAAALLVQCGEDALWGKIGIRALTYLRGRGLRDDTIKHFRVGYIAETYWAKARVWGNPGEITKDIWLPRGIVIPSFYRSEIWYIKIRQPKGDPKYAQVRGSRPSIFNADSLKGVNVTLMTEGEFDCMIAWQELRDVLAPITLGSNTNTPDLAKFGPLLRYPQVFLEAYDNDQAGESGGNRLRKIIKRALKCPIPEGKDVNEFYKVGGDLWEWVKPYLNQVDPTPMNCSLVEESIGLGGVPRDYQVHSTDITESKYNAKGS